jgi:hypothetical protein
MDKNTINKILKSVNANEDVKYNDLRSVASAVGVSVAGKKPDLIEALKGYISTKATEKATKVVVSGRGPGRPKADPSKLIGYKVKIGLRYPTANGELVTSMKEAHTFPTQEAGQAIVDQLVQSGQVRVWGDSVRAQFLPRYGSA